MPERPAPRCKHHRYSSPRAAQPIRTNTVLTARARRKLNYRPVPGPVVPAGGTVVPFGSIVPGGFKAGLPEGLVVLFAPAAMLPASLVRPVLGAPPAVDGLPTVVPVEEPVVVPPVAVPPVEPAPVEPAVCANASGVASEVVSARAVANPIF